MVTLDLMVLIAYMVGILAAGFWAKRKVTNQEEFLVAGRRVGPWLYAGTLAAIVLGGASTVGGSGTAVVVLLLAQGIDSGAPIYAGLGLGLASYIVVSFATRPSDPGMKSPAGPEAMVKS